MLLIIAGYAWQIVVGFAWFIKFDKYSIQNNKLYKGTETFPDEFLAVILVVHIVIIISGVFVKAKVIVLKYISVTFTRTVNFLEPS